MIRDYFGIDYFEADAEAPLHYLLGQPSQRKPSFDQLIPQGLFNDKLNLASNVTCELSKCKSLADSSEEKKEKKIKKRRESTKTLVQGQHRGHWNLDENKKYHWFLQLYSNHFLNKHMRRTDRIFKTMQKFISSREAEQCRSHHQKMEKKHGSFLKILKELRMTHYGSGDSDPVWREMNQNMLTCNEQLLPCGVIQSGVYEKSEFLESERQTINEANELCPLLETFRDPLLQFQCDGVQFLEGLIN